MARQVRRGLHAEALAPIHRRPLDLLIRWRAPWALTLVLAVAALLLAVYRGELLHRLPSYPAAILAFLIVVVLPGLILQRAVLTGAGIDPLTRLAVAPALGLALAAVPGFVALERHLDLGSFAVMHAAVAAAVCGLSLLIPSQTEEAPAPRRDLGCDRAGPLLVVMLGTVLLGVLAAPFWASDRVSGDFDDWTYLAYVREYLDTDQMNAEEPFLGTGESVNPRMRSNVWVVTEALIADVADVSPGDLLFEYLRPLLTVFAVLATYALARTLFRRTNVALLAAAFVLGYAFLDLAPHEGFGRNLFLRITEDKMVGAFLLFPTALVFLHRFAVRPSFAAFAGFALVVLALSVVHPVPLVFIAAAILSLGVLRTFVERGFRPLSAMGLLLVPVALASIWPFAQRQLLADVAPGLFGTGASAITYRNEFHVVELGAGLLMGNYHMILHPLMIAAILSAPLVWLAARREVGNQLVLAVTVGALIVFFVPVLATPVADVMTPQTLWKMPWMVPVAPSLAFVTYEAAGRLARLRPLRWLEDTSVRSRLAYGLLPGLMVVAVLAVALAVQEQYLRLDGGAFYDWKSEESVIPGTEQSIFLGGLDRALSGTWRLNPYEEDLLTSMGESIPAGSVVLADSRDINHVIPGVLTETYPVDFGGTAGEGQRREDAEAFADGSLSPSQLGAVVDRYGVTYIVVTEVSAANESVRNLSRAEWEEEVGPYEIYRVRP